MKLPSLSVKSPLLPITATLILIGIVFISVSSLSEANFSTGDKFYFLKKQITWLAIALVFFFIFSKIKLSNIKKITMPLYGFSILLLIAVLIPGIGNEALGAKRWLNFNFISIQPSELFKFTSVIFFASVFSQTEKRTVKHLLVYLGIPFLLIILEPNLSTAILISAIAITMYYLSGGEIISLFAICSCFVLLSFLLIFTSSYRTARFNSLLNPNLDSTASSYHTNQIILALASGGIMGKGFANSDQKYRFIPKISTDSIMAIVGEETGFLGVSFILLLYIILTAYLFKLSANLKDQYLSLITAGVASWITYQTLINTAAIVALIPLTGVPLPLISYGGSSLVTLLSAIGIVKNIENQHPNLVYSSIEQQDKKNHHHRHSSHPSSRADSPTSKRH